MRKIAFIIPPFVEILDLAGPVQVFSESQFYGLEIEIKFYSIQPNTIASAGLPIGKIENYKRAKLKEGDFVLVPGVTYEQLEKNIAHEVQFFKWLRDCYHKNISVCSICNATFILGWAGLLENRECTTHWRRIERLKSLFPKATVLSDVLFVKSDNIYTSAGVSAGIDMALAIVEELAGPILVHKVARGIVIYHRRSSTHSQQSIYLDYRNHINPKIHEVQDYIIDNLASKITLEQLAALACMSARNLSRVFKDLTKITVIEYITKLRIEKAKTLKNNPNYTIDFIASECGFKSARQLQRIIQSASK